MVFQRNRDGRSRLENRLVENGDDTHRVIHRVVTVLNQFDTAGGHLDRTSGHIHGTEVNLGTRRCRIFSLEAEFVLLGYLFGHGERGVVKLVEAVAVGHGLVAQLGCQP